MSAVGVASEWGVWPLVGVRVPLNASVEPLLTMHNPTHHTIQVHDRLTVTSHNCLLFTDIIISSNAMSLKELIIVLRRLSTSTMQ